MAQNREVAQGLKITRTFQAPKELVFKAWTEPQHLAEWWGPQGFSLKVVKLELRPGGTFLACQSSPEGHSMWGKWVFEDIQPYDRLVFLQSFSDEDGNTIRAPFNPAWPLQILNIIELSETNGQTALTFSGGPIDATDEELQAFAAMSPMVEQGFKGTFDQLDAFLAKHAR